MPAPEKQRGRYAKPVVLPQNLALLTGPTSGIVHLPHHLDWSGDPTYDLDRPGRIIDLYRTVIHEATSPDDLHVYLDETTVKRLWSYIWLSPANRRAWEEKFPQLAQLHHLAKAA